MIEYAINKHGVAIEVITCERLIVFRMGEQFEEDMASTAPVIVGASTLTVAEARRQWMHDKLDAWIDGVEK